MDELEQALKVENTNVAQVTTQILQEHGVSTKNEINLEMWQIRPPKGSDFIIED
jgi:hypothetical protein